MDTVYNYSKEEFSQEDKVKDFLKKRFEQFEKKLKNHIKKLKAGWK